MPPGLPLLLPRPPPSPPPQSPPPLPPLLNARPPDVADSSHNSSASSETAPGRVATEIAPSRKLTVGTTAAAAASGKSATGAATAGSALSKTATAEVVPSETGTKGNATDGDTTAETPAAKKADYLPPNEDETVVEPLPPSGTKRSSSTMADVETPELKMAAL